MVRRRVTIGLNRVAIHVPRLPVKFYAKSSFTTGRPTQSLCLIFIHWISMAIYTSSCLTSGRVDRNKILLNYTRKKMF